jgi:D-threonate/D-erythronate kinase
VHTNYSSRVGIIADDLTSAADGAGPFVSCGLRAVISRKTLPMTESNVAVVDSGSRSLNAAAAAAKVSELTRQLATCSILYKTVDSTLRGHVTAELEAAFAQSARKSVVFAPAFPAAGRTTVNGVQLVDGVPVSKTIYGRDPVHPARTSMLVELMPASVRNINLFDATTQEELDGHVAALPNPEEILWVGSPGMAQALARRIAPEGRRVRPDPPMNGTKVLVAVGTANPLSHHQASVLSGVRDVVLLNGPAERQVEPTVVLDRIAEDAARGLKGGAFGALIATGGDTTEAILDRLNIRQFEVLAELEPGFPLGHAELADGTSLLIAMKAGGFGDDTTLIRAVARLRRAVPTGGRKV